MEYRLTAEVPGVREVTIDTFKNLRKYDAYLDAMFVNYQCDSTEMRARRNNRLLFVNMKKYFPDGRKMVAEAFPHSAVVSCGDMITRNLRIPISAEEHELLRLLSTHFYLVILFSPKAKKTYAYQCVGGNYSETYITQAAQGSLHTTDITRGVIDVFVGGKPIEVSSKNYGAGRSMKKQYLNLVVGGAINSGFGRFLDVSPIEDVDRPIKEAHFDEVMEGLFV